MPDHETIYQSEARTYELLISREDYEQNILKALKEITSFQDMDIVDMGAGSGRLSCLLAPYAQSVTALDQSQAMLQVTADKLQQAGFTRWQTLVSDHRSLPLSDQSADIVVAGWTLSYLTSSNIPDGEKHLQVILAEIGRILRPGGTVIILETLGTGFEVPSPPDFLHSYYALLENVYGFNKNWIRTDYQFQSNQEAEQLTRFFFGDKLADRVAAEGSAIVPECTGLWWKRMS
jgi:ubiquinone/menaquinone biosynthesis C-methylase UbiE